MFFEALDWTSLSIERTGGKRKEREEEREEESETQNKIYKKSKTVSAAHISFPESLKKQSKHVT